MSKSAVVKTLSLVLQKHQFECHPIVSKFIGHCNVHLPHNNPKTWKSCSRMNNMLFCLGHQGKQFRIYLQIKSWTMSAINNHKRMVLQLWSSFIDLIIFWRMYKTLMVIEMSYLIQSRCGLLEILWAWKEVISNIKEFFNVVQRSRSRKFV